MAEYPGERRVTRSREVIWVSRGALMRSVLLALPLVACTLVACTATEPSGDVFAPVAPPAARAPEAPASDDYPAEFRISSEEMQMNAAVARADQVPLDNPVGDAAPAPVSDSEPAPTNVVIAAEPAPETAPPPVDVAPATAWPVRLLKTLPEAQPPRAILGMPDGTEIVVSPGALIAEQGLVVMSVGRSTMDLARVTPSGDHAVIAQVTLTAQY